MITGRDVVIIGMQPWDITIGSNCKNIAIELSKNNRVLYVNEPLNRVTNIRDRHTPEVKKRQNIIKGIEGNLESINKNLWTFYPGCMIESINWLPRSFIYNYLNKRNNRIFYKEIQKAISLLNFRDTILINDSLIFLGFYAPEMLEPSLAVYYIRDNLISQKYFSRHGGYMEPILASKYDVVVANSDYLSNYLKGFNPYSYMIGQGCDLSLFDNTKISEIPSDISNISTPIVGYVGFLTSMRLDISLLEQLALSMPEVSIVLVGPEDEDFMKSRLHYFENVYFLGPKNPNELPAYIASFDVAINPQQVNDLTIGNYPRKVDEYLAMGKPVVATYTDAMAYFKRYVYLSREPEEFKQLIKKALAENNEKLIQERKNFAKSHTWENSVGNLYQVIQQALERNGEGYPVKEAEN